MTTEEITQLESQRDAIAKKLDRAKELRNAIQEIESLLAMDFAKYKSHKFTVEEISIARTQAPFCTALSRIQTARHIDGGARETDGQTTNRLVQTAFQAELEWAKKELAEL